MATFRICDMCGEPIAKSDSVYRLNSTREGGAATVQQQQLCLSEEIHERCMRKLVCYYKSFQRGIR